MKLRLPKALFAVILAAVAADSTYAEGTATMYVKPTYTDPSITWQGTQDKDVSNKQNWSKTDFASGITNDVANRQESTFVFDGSTWTGDKTLTTTGAFDSELLYANGKGTNNTGFVVTGGANVTMTDNRWLCMIVVDAGSTLNLTLGSDSSLKTPASTSATANVYVDGDLTITNPKMCLFGEGYGHWGANDQNWFIGTGGEITLSGDMEWKGTTKSENWNVQVQVDYVDAASLTNRTVATEKKTRTVIATTNAASISSVKLFDLNNEEITDTDNVSFAKTDSGLTVTYTTYTPMDLTWTSGTWSATQAGWSDAEGTDTSFMNGDNVTFSSTTAKTVTVATDGVKPDTMSVTGDFTFNGGSIIATTLNLTGEVALRGTSLLKAGSVNSAELTSLTINGSKYLTISDTGKLGAITTDSTSTLKVSDGLIVEKTATRTKLTIDGNVEVSGAFGSKIGGEIALDGGTVTATRLLLHTGAGEAGNDKLTVSEGSLLKITTDSTATASDQAAAVLGYWGSGNVSMSVVGGFVDIQKGVVDVAWDSSAKLSVSKGELHARGIVLRPTNSSGNQPWDNINSTLELKGGRINVGAEGIYCGNNASYTENRSFNVSGGTLGTLDETEWSVASDVTVGGDFFIDTTVREVSETGASTVKKNGNNDVAGSIKITGAIADSSAATTGNITKTGLGTLTLANANTGYTGNISVSTGTLAVADGAGWGSGVVTVAAAATLSLSGDRTVDTGKISLSTEARGGYLQIASGTMTLTTTASDKTWAVERGTNTSGNIKLGSSDVEGKLDLSGTTANGITKLKYDMVSYTSRNGAGSIKGTGGAELSMWSTAQTFDNLTIDITGGGDRLIQANITNSVMKLNTPKNQTFTFSGQDYTFDQLDVGEKATATTNNKITVNGTASTIAGKLTHAANKSVEIVGSATLTGNGSIQSSGAKPSVLIAAKAPVVPEPSKAAADGEGAGTVETSPSCKVKNVTVSDAGLASADGTNKGTITGGYVALNGAQASNIDFEDVTLNLAEAVTMQNVTFGAGTTLSGTGSVAATGSNTVVLTETAVIADKVAFDSETGVTLTYAGLSGVDFAGTTALTLQFTHDFIVALQKEVLSNYTDTLTIVFDGASNLAESATLSASALTGYPAMSTPSATWVDGNTVQIKFADFDAIPEPATATLSLLVLAGLAARRRRKH